MKTILWMLAVMLVAFSSCNQVPTPDSSDPNLNPPTLSPQAPNCDQEPPPPICENPPPPPPPPPPPIPTNRAFIQLNQLVVVDAQEESWLEDGDEPYFVTIGFRSRFLTPNSTQTFWNGYINGGHFSGLDDGAVRALPTFMNGVSFSNVNRVSLSNRPEVIGAITVAIENDWTSDNTIRSMMNDLQTALKPILVSLVEQGQINLADPAGSVSQAVSQLKASFEPSFWQKVGLFLGSYGNPDDVIGYHLFAFLVTGDAVSFPPSTDPQVSLGVLPTSNLPLTVQFRGDGAVYNIASNIRYVPVN